MANRCFECRHVDRVRPSVGGKRICKRRTHKMRDAGMGGSVRIGLNDDACPLFEACIRRP